MARRAIVYQMNAVAGSSPSLLVVFQVSFWICFNLYKLIVAFNIFMQDPVYGRGKLGEIQGLVLGMLDSFNYEQVSRTSSSEKLLLQKMKSFSYVVP